MRIQEFFYAITGNIGTFLFGLFRFLRLMRPVQNYDSSRIKNILLIRPDRIGDLILATPAFYNIRKHFPQAHITLLIHEQNKDLVFNNANINELLTLNKRGIMTIFHNNLLHRLKIRKFDLAVVLYPSFWSCLLVFLSGISQRLGYDFHGSGFLLTLKLPYRCREVVKHEVEVNLDLLTKIGIKAEEKELEISIDAEAEDSIDKFLQAKGVSIQDKIVVIHPGSYEEYIRWDTSGFAEASDFLIDEYKMKVIILGGPNEEGIVRKVTSLMKNKAVTATGLKLAETVSLIKRARLFIGNSTGPMHIASALKVPVVAIFGNIHPLDSYKKWGPYGQNNIVVHKNIDCVDCNPSYCKRYRCMEVIHFEDVIKAVKKII